MRDHGSFNSMHALSSNITQHGYSILFALVFAEAMGLPVPAALVLLVAGASSAKGTATPRLCSADILLRSPSRGLFAISAWPLYRMVAARHLMQALSKSRLMHSAF